jgi:hypothetical protein
MNELARKRELATTADGEFRQTSGRVVKREGNEWIVATKAGELQVRRAASCLLEPHEGARVLLCEGEGEAFILAILENDPAKSAELSVEGDLRLRAAKGKIAIVAQEGIELLSAATTKIVSNEVTVRARSAKLVSDGIEYAGSWMRGEVDKARVYARSLEQVVERFSLRAKRSFRRVDDMDQTEAGSVHTRVEHTLHTHAKNTALTSDGLVKIDGKEIHVG